MLTALASAFHLPAPVSLADHVTGFWSLFHIDAAYIQGHLAWPPLRRAGPRADELRPAQWLRFAVCRDVAKSLAEVPANAYTAFIARPLCWRLLAQLASFDNDEADPVSREALAHLAQELSHAWASTHEVMYSQCQGTTRSTTSHGPIFGLLGLIVDLGDGELPLVSIAN